MATRGIDLSILPFIPGTDPESTAVEWDRWLKTFARKLRFFGVTSVQDKTDALYIYGGPEVEALLETLPNRQVVNLPACIRSGDGELNEFEKAINKLHHHFSSKSNKDAARSKFDSLTQGSKLMSEYYVTLRKQAEQCQFTDIDDMLRTKIIQTMSDKQLRREAMLNSYTLEQILTRATNKEEVERQANTMENLSLNATCEVNKINTRRRKPSEQKQKHQSFKENSQKSKDQAKPSESQKRTCRYCGKSFPHQGECPARDKTCNYCKKQGHFKTVCRNLKRNQEEKNQVNKVGLDAENPGTEEDYCYSVGTKSTLKKLPNIMVGLNGKSTTVMIDTGASVNIIDEETYKEMGSPKISNKNIPQLFPYGQSKPIPVQGHCNITVKTQNTSQTHKFYVVEGTHGSLIGFPSAQELGLIQIVSRISESELQNQYPGLFKGIGKLKNKQFKLHIDESVTPVAQTSRRTPFHLRPKVEEEIQKLLKQDIIESVESNPTPWVSPIVTPPKKDGSSIRLCIDMREPNKAIERERHQMPTVNEIINDVNGSAIFSKIDLRSGYHQLELEESSRYITTFATHLGLFRYKRLNFGISSAAEVFQKAIQDVVRDVSNAKNISDDIIIYGKNKKEHDAALHKVFKKLHENGLTINLEKCEFGVDTISFFGFTFSEKGISPDPKKTTAIENMKPPQNPSEVISFLGMTNFMSRFIPNYATINEPLRNLTKKDTQWTWNKKEQDAFDQLREVISNESINAYYDPKKTTSVIVDASPVGLGAMLVQGNQVIAYSSRSLTSTETRYSQTEREALAIVWACEHFDMYLRGAQSFTVITDHKPLENIWKKKNPPLRIERWGLRLQPYKFSIIYQPGANNPADFMSRHPEKRVTSQEEDLAETYVNFITEQSVPKALTLEEVKKATQQDATLVKAMELTRSGRWHDTKHFEEPSINASELKSLKEVKEELTCHSDGILLKGNQIVLPTKLRAQAISIAHEGHQGMTRTKSFIRSKVWFPRINQAVEEAIKNCLPCQIVTESKSSMEPLQMSEMPETPWTDLSMDFCGPLPTGEYLMVVIDEFSRYPVVEIIPSTSAKTVIPVLDKIISMFGIPKVIKSDNGSPFNSHEFSRYASHMGFKHRKITPHWPRANAQAESFNKPMMKTIRAARVEHRNWKQDLHRFLRQYRETMHNSTGFSPYELLFNRKPSTKLPSCGKEKNDMISQAAKAKDMETKKKQKKYADKRNNAKENQIQVGDTVLVRNDQKKDKWSTNFRNQPYEVISRKGNMVTSQSADHVVTRNVSRYKQVPNSIRNSSSDRDDNPDTVCPYSVVPSTSPAEVAVPEPAVQAPDNDATHEEQHIAISTSNNATPRLKRTRKTPAYLKDFVTQ